MKKCGEKECHKYDETEDNNCRRYVDIQIASEGQCLILKKAPSAKLHCSDLLDAFRSKLAESCFITCESGGGKDYFVKVQFKRLEDTQKFHAELIKIAGGI